MNFPPPIPGMSVVRRIWHIAVLSMLLVTGLASAQPGTISGVAKDTSGSVVGGAVVALDTVPPTYQRTALTNDAGSFRFFAVEPGTYTLAITATGFSSWTSTNVIVHPGENLLPPSVLQIATTSTNIDVTLSPHDLATEQIKAEEKQRLLAIFPNFFVTYDPNAAPLTAAQKFELGWKSLLDPVAVLETGIGAGIQQARDHYPEFGEGAEGYAKRFGALYATRASSIMIGRVLTHAVFRQDPRYFYKGTGSFGSRVLYAIGTAFVAKGDNRHWQPDYSDVVGNLAAAEISTLYYPASSRNGRRLVDNVLLGFGSRAGRNLIQEFVFKKVSTHVSRTALASSLPVLPEGTPIPLISVEDLSAKTPSEAGPISLMLSGDLRVGSLVVAKAGSPASGQVTYASAGVDSIEIRLDRVRLKVGALDVPLRSTQLKDGDGPVEYHRLENSGRIAIVLYVAATIPLPEP